MMEKMIRILRGVNIDTESELLCLMKGKSACQVGAAPLPVQTRQLALGALVIRTTDVDDKVGKIEEVARFLVKLLADGEDRRIVSSLITAHPMISFVTRGQPSDLPDISDAFKRRDRIDLLGQTRNEVHNPPRSYSVFHGVIPRGWLVRRNLVSDHPERQRDHPVAYMSPLSREI